MRKKSTVNCCKAWLLIIALSLMAPVCAKEMNGFVLDGALIPSAQIFSGGPDKDGIPAIDNPKFVSAVEANFINDEDRVLGIAINGVAKAYPIKILNWHEVVNDAIEKISFTVTYCPLCGSGVAFDSRIDAQVLSFGVSGLLYNSDVLIYDRETESLWSQLLSKAISGKHRGKELKMLPVTHTTWADWKRLHPATMVLSNSTGYQRQYSKDPYSGYQQSRHLYFPVMNEAPKKYHPKEKVLGLISGKTFKAYPFIELNKYNKENFVDTVGDRSFTVHWNKKQQSGYIVDKGGAVVPVVQSYWFAWYAFHPETRVFTGR